MQPRTALSSFGHRNDDFQDYQDYQKSGHCLGSIGLEITGGYTTIRRILMIDTKDQDSKESVASKHAAMHSSSEAGMSVSQPRIRASEAL